MAKFTEAGFAPKSLPLSHFEDDYGLAPIDGEDEDEDEDSEDEQKEDEDDGEDSEDEVAQ